MQILNEWLEDIPQQFKGKKNIEILFAAFARQLEEVYQVLLDINEKTTLENAVGRNLDYIGNILSMSRADATKIIRQRSSYKMDDELYRKCLKYQILKETGSCTYAEIMGATADLWDVDTVQYKEKAEEPATIRLHLGSYDMESIDPIVGRVLAFKSAGVALIYEVAYNTKFQNTNSIRLKRIGIRFIDYNFLWDSRKLDGTWILDGSVTFSDFRTGHLKANPTVSGIRILEPSHPHWYWELDGETLLDGGYPFSNNSQNLNVTITTKNKEE